jgi:two-component system phosphate regulon sensor histidine kinase PhoR
VTAAWLLVGILLGLAIGALLAMLLRRRALREFDLALGALAALSSGRQPERFYAPQGNLAEREERFNEVLQQLGERLDALELDRMRFLAIIRNLRSGVVLLDARRRVQVINPAAERIFGVWAPEVEQTYHLAMTHTYALESALDEVEKGEVLQLERREAGRTLQIDLAPVPGTGGTLLVVHDVTEERRLLEIRSQFVANVSHELRTPLTVLGGFAETLLDGAVDEGHRQRFLRHIAEETRRLSLLVDDLLRLAAIESGRERPERTRVDILELARAVAERYGPETQARGVALGVEGQPAMAITDRDRIEGILISLIDNAVKYTQDGGHVTVRVSAAAGQAELTVADDGPGIPEADLPHIFERFYRVDRSRQRATGGSGLGLAIARHLALSVGAELTVESELGRGSAFHLRIPGMAKATDA